MTVTQAPPATGTRPRRARRRRQPTWPGLVFVAPGFLLTVVLFVIPFGLMVWMSLHAWPLLGQTKFIGLDNYVKALTEDTTFLHSLWFTMVYTVIITPVLYFLGLGLAFFVKRSTRVSAFFRTVFFSPYVIGFAAASFLWLWFTDPNAGSLQAILDAFGVHVDQTSWVLETWPGLINVIVMVNWKVVGFQMILLLAGLNSIPDEVVEAAQIDGAGWWQRLVHIILPLLRPTTLLLLVYSVAGSILAFEQFFLITKGRPSNQTVTAVYWIYNVSFTKFNLGYGAALSMLVLILLVAVTAIQIRFIAGRGEEP